MPDPTGSKDYSVSILIHLSTFYIFDRSWRLPWKIILCIPLLWHKYVKRWQKMHAETHATSPRQNSSWLSRQRWRTSVLTHRSPAEVPYSDILADSNSSSSTRKRPPCSSWGVAPSASNGLGFATWLLTCEIPARQARIKRKLLHSRSTRSLA